MSDFFGLLSRRALQPAAIHPRLPSRFASDSGLPGPPPEPQASAVSPSAERPLQVPPATRRTVEPTRPVSPLPPDGPAVLPAANVAQSAPPALPAASRGAPRVAVAELPGAPPHSPASPPPLLASVPLVAPPSPPVQPPAPGGEVLERHERHMHSERLERHELIRERIERRVERLLPAEASVAGGMAPAGAAAAAAPLPAPSPVVSAPRVEISIGRIEVLPLEAAPPPRREAAPPRPPAQSLEAYLQERTTGKPGRGGRA